jgi:ABC-type transport system substrate-binding protein
MKVTSSQRIAAISGVAITLMVVAAPGFTARRPRYGGRLIVEIGATVASVDLGAATANDAEENAKAQIDALVFDGDAGRRSDDSTAAPGPFRVAEWEPGKHALLVANENYKGGRPFVDAVEIRMGRPAKDRLIDLELNKADLAEIPLDQARRAVEQGIRVSRSQPDELIALVFEMGRPGAKNPRIREAIARSMDRGAIVNFILQKEGEAAGGLLPQWSSGTAFLFLDAHGGTDMGRAKELWSQIASAPKIVLGYDSTDPQGQAVAERIVVNAREAGISMSLQVTSKAGRQSADARLVRLRMPSKDPRMSLAEFLDDLNPVAGLAANNDPLPDPATPKQIYEREFAVVRSFLVIPIAWVPQVYGLSSRVRDWQAPGPGESWPLADVWLDDIEAQSGKITP